MNVKGLRLDFFMKNILKSKLAIFLTLVVLFSITMYKLNRDVATPKEIQIESLKEAQDVKSSNPKDPFKEALEKQTLQVEKKMDPVSNQPVRGVESKDPFKEFLEKQSKELNSSKVSPFEVVK